MRTAMQLMLWYLKNEGLEESGAYYKAKMLLEKEKEQIIEAVEFGLFNMHTTIDGKYYYDLKFNQNK
jgi:hypothetical protein